MKKTSVWQLMFGEKQVILHMDLKNEDPGFSAMQNVKRRFFALRNGIVADTLRRAGDPHRIIFGLTLPQLAEIASSLTGNTDALADDLWDNRSTRESRLLAPMLMAHRQVNVDKATEMFLDVMCIEEADILCHRLLRHLPFAMDLIELNRNSGNPLTRYTALRLMLNIVSTNPHRAMQIAQDELERNDTYTRRIAMQLADETDFIINGC